MKQLNDNLELEAAVEVLYRELYDSKALDINNPRWSPNGPLAYGKREVEVKDELRKVLRKTKECLN